MIFYIKVKLAPSGDDPNVSVAITSCYNLKLTRALTERGDPGVIHTSL